MDIKKLLHSIGRKITGHGQEQKAEASPDSVSVIGYKMTDAEGHVFYTKDEKYRLAVGKTITEEQFDGLKECGKGIHFGRTLSDAMYHGIAAAEGFDPGYSLVQKGIKVFKVKGTDVIPLDRSDKLKAREITVLEEVRLDDHLPELLGPGGARVLEFLGACAAFPPGMMALLKEVRNQWVQAGRLMNPKNPDRLRVGDQVRLSALLDHKGMQKMNTFFAANREVVVARIKPQPDHVLVEVRGETGQTYTLGLGWLEKVGSGPGSTDRSGDPFGEMSYRTVRFVPISSSLAAAGTQAGDTAAVPVTPSSPSVTATSTTVLTADVPAPPKDDPTKTGVAASG